MKYIATVNYSPENLLAGEYTIDTLDKLFEVARDVGNFNEIKIMPDFIERYMLQDSVEEFTSNLNAMNPKLKISSNYGSRISGLAALNYMLHYEDLVSYLYREKNKGFKLIRDIAEIAEKHVDTSLSVSSTIDSLESKIRELEELNEDLTEELALSRKDAMRSKTAVEDIISSYDRKYNTSFAKRQIKSNKYRKVIYIKEYGKAFFMTTLVKMLKEVINIMTGSSVKILIIESSGAYKKVETLYRDFIPDSVATYSDLLNKDIVTSGYNNYIANALANNVDESVALIILDKTQTDDIYFTGDNVALYYSTHRDVNELGLPVDKTISAGQSKYSVPFIKDFHLKSEGEQLNIYSSQPIIKDIVKEVLDAKVNTNVDIKVSE